MGALRALNRLARKEENCHGSGPASFMHINQVFLYQDAFLMPVARVYGSCLRQGQFQKEEEDKAAAEAVCGHFCSSTHFDHL